MHRVMWVIKIRFLDLESVLSRITVPVLFEFENPSHFKIETRLTG